MATTRLMQLRKRLAQEQLDAALVTQLPQIRYLTGFSGSAGLLVVTPQRADFLTDFRYKDQSRAQVRGAKVTIVGADLMAELKKHPLLAKKNTRVGYHADSMTVAYRELLVSKLPHLLFVRADALFGDLGWIKDHDGLENIKAAARIADTTFERILPLVKPGVRECDLQAEMEYQMLMLGSERPAFETIVASGYRSALPHGVASKKKLGRGEFVTFDFGATVKGFVSDLTRTVFVGTATARHKKIYNLVLKAQLAGIKAVRAGVAARKVDQACRDIITRAGYGKEFGHGTGHGIGIVIHTGPRLATTSSDILAVNHVVTIEPGIYIPRWGGVRIEDDVVVTQRGATVLTHAEKKLLEL